MTDDYSNAYSDGLHDDREAARDRQAQAAEYAREAGAFDDPPPSIVSAARRYLAAGLAVLPARRGEKRPTISWKPYQTQLPTTAELDTWFASDPSALCVLAGQISGHLELIDFDNRGELFERWAELVEAAAPGLVRLLVVSETQSGGRHVAYRCPSGVSGNLKLAQRRLPDGQTVTLIETRGEGGLFLCPPTLGYTFIRGDLAALPCLSAEERETLLAAAWELNECPPPVIDGPPPAATPPTGGPVANGGAATPPAATCGPVGANTAARPGDDYNNRGDVRVLLQQHGWVLTKPGDNEHWRRPGKTAGMSATLKDRVFYVFSSNAAPFEPEHGYSPFAVYALLEHGGSYEQAARALRLDGYGGADELPDAGVDLSAIVGQAKAVSATAGAPPENPGPPDPGPLPDELLRLPGFISEVMDHCLETAPYPNQTMAFAGTLSLQAFLAGRKVRDPGDNRTNVYLLGLAHSAAGKDWPRKVNTRILHEVALAECLGERFASGEGIQDALFLQPSMLFQTDEIDGMLQSINKAKDARHESILSTLLTVFSASNSYFPMRRKAGKESPGVIDQPSLVIFGTAIPNHYYEALSERMLTNGFFARMIILEAGQRGTGQEPTIRDLPPRVLATAKWWAAFQPGEHRGNLLDIHPMPKMVEHTDEARRLLIETRHVAETEYTAAEVDGDTVGTTVWGRVSEQVRKLSLIYAISENHVEPQISLAAVQWASRFVIHQTRRMLFMAAGHVAENPFHAECLKVIQKLRDAPDHALPHQVLLKRMKMEAAKFRDLMQTLITQGDVGTGDLKTAGRTGLVYRLVTPRGEE